MTARGRPPARGPGARRGRLPTAPRAPRPRQPARDRPSPSADALLLPGDRATLHVDAGLAEPVLGAPAGPPSTSPSTPADRGRRVRAWLSLAPPVERAPSPAPAAPCQGLAATGARRRPAAAPAIRRRTGPGQLGPPLAGSIFGRRGAFSRFPGRRAGSIAGVGLHLGLAEARRRASATEAVGPSRGRAPPRPAEAVRARSSRQRYLRYRDAERHRQQGLRGAWRWRNLRASARGGDAPRRGRAAGRPVAAGFRLRVRATPLAGHGSLRGRTRRAPGSGRQAPPSPAVRQVPTRARPLSRAPAAWRLRRRRGRRAGGRRAGGPGARPLHATLHVRACGCLRHPGPTGQPPPA